jgi:RNA polymerase sigma factor (sigma-70 family)
MRAPEKMHPGNTSLQKSMFTEAYNRYYASIFSVIYSRTRNADDTSDLCQEVFTRFFEKFETVENHRKWLFGTMRNVLLEYYRRKYGKDVDVDEVFNDISVTFVNGFRDTRLLIEEVLACGENYEDETDMILFDLIALYGFTYHEAGTQLGISQRQARYRYGIIVKRIVDLFRKKGIHSLEELL